MEICKSKKLNEIYNSGTTRLLISLYDGPEQILKFKKMISECNIPENFVVLRDRWYSDKIDYGVKLTNRVGTVKIGNQPDTEDFKKKNVFILHIRCLLIGMEMYFYVHKIGKDVSLWEI